MPAHDASGPAEPDEELVTFAIRLFALARRGDAETLAAYVDAGVSPDLGNQSGDTLLNNGPSRTTMREVQSIGGS